MTPGNARTASLAAPRTPSWMSLFLDLGSTSIAHLVPSSFIGKCIRSLANRLSPSHSFERTQYLEVYELWRSNKPDFAGKTPSDFYGIEHLCRLLGKLPLLPHWAGLMLYSYSAGAHCSDQYGPAIRQAPLRGIETVYLVCFQEFYEVLCL
jgi:hypothetical protein